jgi:hypothetical protein
MARESGHGVFLNIHEYGMAKSLEGLFLHFGTENILGKHNAMLHNLIHILSGEAQYMHASMPGV